MILEHPNNPRRLRSPQGPPLGDLEWRHPCQCSLHPWPHCTPLPTTDPPLPSSLPVTDLVQVALLMEPAVQRMLVVAYPMLVVACPMLVVAYPMLQLPPPTCRLVPSTPPQLRPTPPWVPRILRWVHRILPSVPAPVLEPTPQVVLAFLESIKRMQEVHIVVALRCIRNRAHPKVTGKWLWSDVWCTCYLQCVTNFLLTVLYISNNSPADSDEYSK
jgi:hypothetical protein